MADKKISELTALTGANVATDDQLVIVDTSAALTKSITIDEFKNALDTATGFVRITGDTMTGDLSMSGANITLGDSSGVSDDRIVLGDDSDLLIYHNNPNSFIRDQGNGNFFITTDGNYIFLAKDDLTNMATFQVDGPVDLYHAGSPKLSTTSTGVDITGVLSSDGLTVDGVEVINTGSTTAYSAGMFTGAPVFTPQSYDGLAIQASTDGFSSLYMESAGLTGYLGERSARITVSPTPLSSYGTDIIFNNRRTNAAMSQALKIDGNGDISFYEDQGTTAKFFWSAADERLGIGTSSPSAALHIASSGGTVSLVEASSGYNARVRIQSGNANESFLEFADTDDSDVGEIVYSHANNSMRFNTNATERMRIDSSGNVGIGESNPDAKLHIRDATDGGSSSTTSAIQFSRRSGGANDAAIKMQHDGSDGVSNLQFHFGTSEAMRIDSSGNLLVGHTSITDWTTTAGAQVRGTGYVIGSVDGDYSFIANRLTSDGDIMQFRKDGATVGSIGTNGGVLTVGNANTGGIIFGYNAGHTFIEPSNTSGASTDDLATLGSGTKRFRDLYLSGGIEIENGTGNVGVGKQALNSNTGTQNTAVGKDALNRNTTSSYNTAVGLNAGYFATGEKNTFIGHDAGSASSFTGSSNTILGRYNANQNGLDIRTSSNNIVLSDGDGNPRTHWDSNGAQYGPAANYGGFITAEITQSHLGNDASGTADITYTLTLKNTTGTYDNWQVMMYLTTSGNSSPAKTSVYEIRGSQRSSAASVNRTTLVSGETRTITSSVSGLVVTFTIASEGSSTATQGAKFCFVGGTYGCVSVAVGDSA